MLPKPVPFTILSAAFGANGRATDIGAGRAIENHPDLTLPIADDWELLGRGHARSSSGSRFDAPLLAQPVS